MSSFALETITRTGGTAPYTYTVSETGVLEPSAIRAVFDGTSATTAFRPCLTIRAQDGTILSRTFPTDTVAAGETAEVTYHPFGG